MMMMMMVSSMRTALPLPTTTTFAVLPSHSIDERGGVGISKTQK
jgi:hypothetical protein